MNNQNKDHLDWFKISASEYTSSNIFFRSLELKGLFQDMRVMYWQRKRNLPLEDILLRHDRMDLIVELEKIGMIKIIDGNISIESLDIQYEKVEEKSKKAKESIKKRWENKRYESFFERMMSDPNSKKACEEISLREGVDLNNDFIKKSFNQFMESRVSLHEERIGFMSHFLDFCRTLEELNNH